MGLAKIISAINVLPEKTEIAFLKKETAVFVEELRQAIKDAKISAEVFVGGSSAKGTLVKKKNYEIDIFVRFDWEYEALSDDLEPIVKKLCKMKKVPYLRIHGSRDYFRFNSKGILFELIPVSKIKKPREARNVTDLSYFHVTYVKRNLNAKMAQQVAIAKTFCKAQGVYGAESYIKGFSGYALECLIIHYKTFEKMLKELSKVKDRLILDPSKQYKTKDEIVINLNESKIHSPIVLVDPTWKERNVLAALSNETFHKFQNMAKMFLQRPSANFFEERQIDPASLSNEAKKKKFEFLQLTLKTDRQVGDIAGTKLKKFCDFILSELKKYFEIESYNFAYDEYQTAKAYIMLRSKKEIIKIGPPIEMKKAVMAFKKKKKNTFVQNGLLHTKIKINFSAQRFLQDYIKKYKKKIKEMSITDIKIE